MPNEEKKRLKKVKRKEEKPRHDITSRISKQIHPMSTCKEVVTPNFRSCLSDNNLLLSASMRKHALLYILSDLNLGIRSGTVMKFNNLWKSMA